MGSRPWMDCSEMSSGETTTILPGGGREHSRVRTISAVVRNGSHLIGSRLENQVKAALPECDWVYFATPSKEDRVTTRNLVDEMGMIHRAIYNRVGIPTANTKQLRQGDGPWLWAELTTRAGPACRPPDQAIR